MDTYQPARDFVLLVEDDLLIRRATTRLLRRLGYVVRAASNGLSAIRFLHRRAHPRLILLDLHMPIMDGWKFRQQQQDDPKLSSIPVILLSSAEHLEETAAALHADGYLQKPVDVEALVRAVASKFPRAIAPETTPSLPDVTAN